TANTEGVVKVWDLAARRTVATVPANPLAVGYRAAFSRDRRLVAIGCENGTIKLVKTDEPPEAVRTLEAHTNELAAWALSADDERWASSGNAVIVRVWAGRRGREAFALDSIKGRVNGLAFGRAGHRLAMGSADGTVRILDGTPLDGPVTAHDA